CFPCPSLSVPRLTLFPYTTLFRSLSVPRVWGRCPWSRLQDGSSQGQNRLCQVLEPVWVAITHRGAQCSFHGLFGRQGETLLPGRSEEHTSELQSRFDLVCRLLLEK